MIAADTSSLIDYFQGKSGEEIKQIDECFNNHNLILPPVVLAELLSDYKMPEKMAEFIKAMPVMEIKPGYWIRCGKLRAKILGKGLKARMADTLISQICIDHNIPLIARDKDFHHFVKYGSLVLFK